MKVNLTSTKGLVSKLNVIVAKKEIQKNIENKIDEVKDKINLKGFRPGKVPKDLLKKQFGKALYSEVIEKTLNDSAFQALKENNIKPACQPKIDVKSSGEDKDLEFSIEVEKVPKIKKISLEKIILEKYEVKPDKKDMDDRLNQLAESSKKYKDKDVSKPAEINDLVEFNYEATVDGNSFDGNKGDKLQVVLGKDLFIKGFDKQMIGAKKNEEKTVKIKLPENYPKKELSGRNSEFKCRIINIKYPVSQKIDDDFAKNMGAKDLVDLKSMIEKQITKEFDGITSQLMKKKILDQLDDQFKIELPKSMVEEETKTVEQTFIQEKMNEKNEKDFSKIKLDENDKKSIKKISERRVKLALVLNNIGEEYSINVTPQELQVEVEKQLRMYPGQENTIKEYYQKNPAGLSKLRGPLFEEKVMNLIIGKAIVKNKTIQKEELSKLMNNKIHKNVGSKSSIIKKTKIKKTSKK